MPNPCVWRQEAAFETLSRAGHSVCAWQGKLLVFGGRLSSTFFADVWAYDPACRSWEVWCDSWPHAPRSYHSTTLVGGEVWLCGGSGVDTVVEEVLAFDPATRRWRCPTLRGDLSLLRRTAHGSCLHPARPECILLQGGYGGGSGSNTQDYSYLSDLVEINTRTGVVRALRPAGSPPDPRAYHVMCPLGPCCYVLAGRTHNNRLVKGKQTVVVWDAAANRWITPGVGGGELSPRSSHRAAPVPGGILLFGGAVDRGAKAADLQLLTARGSHLSWRQCQPGGSGGDGSAGGWPQGRGAHAVEVLGSRFYVLGGYGEGRQYTGDCWSVSLEAVGGCDAAPPAAAMPEQQDAAAKRSGTGSQPAAALPEASQWRDARRSRAAAGFAFSEPQLAAKRQRAARQQQVAAAAAAPVAAAWGENVAPGSCQLADRQQAAVQPPPPQQQAVLPSVAAAAVAATAEGQQRLAELQAALQQQQVTAAAREQLVLDLQRENAELAAQCAKWEAAARDRQAVQREVQAAAMQHSAQMAELQRQLSAAQRERDEAVRAAADAEHKADMQVQELRAQHRRERDARERDDLQRDQLLQSLREQLEGERRKVESLAEAQRGAARQLEKLQEDVSREQQAHSEARRAAGEERARMVAQLNELKEEAAQAQQRATHGQALLEQERAALRDAAAELERQLKNVQAQAERARRAEEERDGARRRAEELQREVAALRAAEERWRGGKAALATALAAAQRGLESMP